jgi:uncharacterized protein
MSTKIFVNLPVKDLRESMGFFDKLGFTFNPQFTDETAACMVISDSIYAMLLTHAKFKEFTPKAICDATKSTEVLVCLSCESRAQVDDNVRKAVAAGGSTYNEPQDHGFMYAHGFQDLDGHILGTDVHGPERDQARVVDSEISARRMKMPYVDGFLLPVPKKNVQAYRRMASKSRNDFRIGIASMASGGSRSQSIPLGASGGKGTSKHLSGVAMTATGRSCGSAGKTSTSCMAWTVVTTGMGGCPSSLRIAYSRSP